VLSFLDQLIGAHLYILIKQIASEDLLSVLVVDQVGAEEKQTESALSHKLHVLVVEENVIVVQKQELIPINTQINIDSIMF
jgi:hypothetical protein